MKKIINMGGKIGRSKIVYSLVQSGCCLMSKSYKSSFYWNLRNFLLDPDEDDVLELAEKDEDIPTVLPLLPLELPLEDVLLELLPDELEDILLWICFDDLLCNE